MSTVETKCPTCDGPALSRTVSGPESEQTWWETCWNPPELSKSRRQLIQENISNRRQVAHLAAEVKRLRSRHTYEQVRAMDDTEIVKAGLDSDDRLTAELANRYDVVVEKLNAQR